MDNRLWSRFRDWVILYGLLVVSIIVMVTENDPMLRGMRLVALDVTGRVEARMAWTGRLVGAIRENEALRRDNIELSSRLARLREADLQIRQLTDVLEFRSDAPLRIVAARIVGKNIFGQSNYLTLDVGRANGVEVDMPVVSTHGIIGRVILASDHYCRVMPFMNTNFNVSAEILPLQAVGIVSWPARRADRLLLENVVKTEAVEIGQLVVTGKASIVFPPGYAVGTIAEINQRPGENFLDILVEPATPLSTTQHAFVLLRTADAERVELEADTVE